MTALDRAFSSAKEKSEFEFLLTLLRIRGTDYQKENAVVIVREGYGAVGLKDAWTKEELATGKINWSIARFTKEEFALLDNNPDIALLPRHREEPNPIQ